MLYLHTIKGDCDYAVLVTGARQTGKTTLLRTEFGASHHYHSLERPDARARALADPVAFLTEAGAPLILDEIQYAPELLHYIKDSIDADRAPGRWLMTGSQSCALMQGISQTLSGRVAVLTLDPLSTSEALARAGARIVAADVLACAEMIAQVRQAGGEALGMASDGRKQTSAGRLALPNIAAGTRIAVVRRMTQRSMVVVARVSRLPYAPTHGHSRATRVHKGAHTVLIHGPRRPGRVG